MGKDDKFHYCVLFTQTGKQEQLKTALQRSFPEDRGTVFLPGMECWRRDKNRIEVKPLFPGYVFVRSDMGMGELHEFVRAHRTDVRTFIRELALSERIASGEDALREGGDDEDEYELKDLTEEETEFLDLMLDGEGILKMSVGYCEKGKYVIMEGPLKGFEGRIVDVDRHNRKAFLDFGFRGCVAKAGLELRPKRSFFPDDKDAPAMLEDGTEVDLLELGKRMMGR